ncbi:hypothetical protein DBADOPDK_04166 [Pseudomonas sp. MM223]|nr:hypothetical protein DBADOPDK_04166 [Pseudomonas sp. MM223]
MKRPDRRGRYMASDKKESEVKKVSSGWRVLMVQHPLYGYYYAAGFKLGQ